MADNKNVGGSVVPLRRTAAVGRDLSLATGTTVKDNAVTNSTTTWPEFCTLLRDPVVTNESVKKYHSLDRATQDRIKDVGYYVFGKYSGVRKKENLQYRDAITLDLDHCPEHDWQADIEHAFSGMAFALHSTHKHTPAAPRLRQVFPLTRRVTSEEYEPIARKLADRYKIDIYDKTTFQYNRVMHMPSCSKDGEYVFEVYSGKWVDPDAILAEYDDWTDIEQWPAHEGGHVGHLVGEKAPDPRAKQGWVGAFCRAYSISEAMDQFIPQAYSRGSKGRYSFTGGTTSNGAVTYDNDLFLYSHHETDPCSGRLVNAFDMVRLHLYGELDKRTREDTPIFKKPSYAALITQLQADPELSKAVAVERAKMIREDFDGFEDAPGAAEEYELGTPARDDGGIEDLLGSNGVDDVLGASDFEDGRPDLDSVTTGFDPEEDFDDLLGGHVDIGMRIDSARITNPVSPSDWEVQLSMDKHGRFTKNLHNVSLIMAYDDEWGHNIRYNEFGGFHVLTKPVGHRSKKDFSTETARVNGSIFADRDVPQVQLMLERKWGLEGVSKEMVFGSVEITGTKNRFHPVLQYLSRLPTWDGVPRVETLLVDYLGAEDTEYTRNVTRKVLCAAINRIKNPGSKWDYMLILEGLQGVRKGMFLSALAKNPSWFAEGIGRDLGEKAVENMAAKWICELPEGEGMVNRRSDDELKAFLTRSVDRMRPKYGRVAIDYPRQCIFIMTTNRHEYLTDSTGHRRFWPVRCEMSKIGRSTVDISTLTRNIDQIWAEALVYWLKGENLWLDPAVEALAKEEQAMREIDDGLAGRIEAWLDAEVDDDFDTVLKPRDKTCVREIWAECFGEPEIRLTRLWSNMIVEAMNKLARWKYLPLRRDRFDAFGQQRVFVRRGSAEDY